MLARVCGCKSYLEGASRRRCAREFLHSASKSSSGSKLPQGRLENDPYEVASKVSKLLRQRKYDNALLLVKNKSRDVSMADKYTVSWNRLIEYNMKRGGVTTAFKMYNEMKRRRQQPDSYTYTHLLLGMRRNVEYQNAASGALSLWNTLCAPQAIVGPQTIHGNAVLHIAWKTNDMETFWSVVNKMSHNKKNCQPDIATYTIILSALCDNAITNPNHAEEYITQGRQIWEEVIKKWEEGWIRMDGRLASTFCQLLLSGQRPKDFDFVFSVIQDVYGIQRVKPPLDSVLPRLTNHIIPLVPETEILDSLLAACRKFRQKNAAQTYWSVFVNTYKIVPDLSTTHTLIRILGDTRDSEAVLEIIRETQSRGIEPTSTTIYLALQACRRCANFNDAKQVIALSQKCGIEISAKLMYTLLKVADVTEDEKVYLQALELLASMPKHVLRRDDESLNTVAMVKKLCKAVKKVDFLLFKTGHLKDFFQENEKMWLSYGTAGHPSEASTVQLNEATA